MTDLTFNIEAEDNATGTLNETAKEVENVGQKTDEAGQEMEKAGKKSDGLSKGLGGVKAGALAAAAGLAAAAAGAKKAIAAYAEQEQVERRLQFAIRNTVDGTEAQTAAYQEFVRIAAENQRTTIFGDEDQLAAAQQLLVFTNDITEAQNLMNVAMDLATVSGKELSAVTNNLGQVYQGNIAPLQRFGILTKDQVRELNKVEDVSERVAVAMEAIREKSEGARTEISATAQAMAQFENDGGDAEQSAGKLLLAMANLGLTMADTTEKTEESDSALTRYANAWSDMADSINEVAVAWSAVSLSEAFAPTSNSALFSIIDQAEDELARMSGHAERTAASFKDMSKEADKLLNLSGSERSTPALPWTREAFENMVKNTDEQLKQAKIRREENAELARRNELAELGIAMMTTESEIQRAYLEHEQALVELRGRDLTALERRLELLRLNEKTAERIAGLTGPDEQEFVPREAPTIATVDSGQFVTTGIGESSDPNELEDSERDAASKAMRDAEMVSGSIGGGFAQSTSALAGFNDEMATTVELLGVAASSSGTLVGTIMALSEEQWNFADATEATAKGLQAVSQIGAAAAGILGESVKEQATIRAIFETAAAAGAIALGIAFPPAAPQYFAAAAQHGIAAGTYGLIATGAISPSSGAGGPSAGASVGGGSTRLDVEAERQATADAIAEAITGENVAGGLTLNLDLGSGNVIPNDSPRFAQIVTDTMQRGVSQTLGRQF